MKNVTTSSLVWELYSGYIDVLHYDERTLKTAVANVVALMPGGALSKFAFINSPLCGNTLVYYDESLEIMIFTSASCSHKQSTTIFMELIFIKLCQQVLHLLHALIMIS